jgi:hypothetical protein
MANAPAKQKAILYLDKTQFYFYLGALPDVIKYDYPNAIISDIEVIDKPQLTKQLNAFIEQYKIPASNILILLSKNVVFTKDLPDMQLNLHQQEINTFLDNIPFELMYNRTYRMKKGAKMVVANRDLCQEIYRPFEARDSNIDIISPIVVAEAEEKIVEAGFNIQTAKLLLTKYDSFKQYNMLNSTNDSFSTPVTEQTVAPLKPPSTPVTKATKETMILGGVFGVLVIVLIIVVFVFANPFTSNKPEQPATTPAPVANAPAVPPTATPLPPTSTPAPLDVSKYKIQVLNGSGVSGRAETVRKQLSDAGFTNIKTGNSTSTNSKTLILFSSKLDTSVREMILSTVDKVASDSAVQEASNIAFDSIITVGGK